MLTNVDHTTVALSFQHSERPASNAAETPELGSERVNISLKESKRRGLQVLRQPKAAMRMRCSLVSQWKRSRFAFGLSPFSRATPRNFSQSW
jgi:hypothetical protein